MVTAVVVNWNGWQDTLRCIKALHALPDAPAVVVVDNASTDDSLEQIRAAHPDVPIIEAADNLGYAGGNNLGIRWALERGADFVLVLNNDALVGPTTIKEAVAATSNPEVGIVACRVVGNGHVQDTGGGGVFHAETPVDCPGCDLGVHPCEYVMGPALLLRTAMLREIGLIDETYFHYFEERDLAERARRAHWMLVLACRGPVDHGAGNSLSVKSPQSGYYFVRNLVLYRSRFLNVPRWKVLLEQRRLLRAHVAPRHVLRTRDPRMLFATALAAWDALRGRTGRRDLGDNYRRELPFFPRATA